MNYIKYLLISLLFFPAITTLAQRDFISAADRDFEDQKYAIAIDKYKKAYSKTNDRDEKNRIRFQMAESYRLMNNTKRAEIYYKGLYRTKYYKKEPVVLLHYANMLKSNEKYDEAIPYFDEYIKLRADDPRGPDGLKSCMLQKEWFENPTNHQITNVKTINSREDDFAPAFMSDNFNALLFTSNREGSTGKDADEWTGKNFTDLYQTRQDRKGSWSVPDLLDTEEKINTETNEGIAQMNSSFTTLYFTRCGNEKNAQSGCHIYKSKKTGRNFSDAEIVPLGGDSTSAIGHPTLSEDEKTIIFAADFEGGYGGKDLWYATRKSTADDFGMPKNMGPAINTVQDELFPFLRNDTVLYFSSNGHIGMGLLDIFKTTFSNDSWGVPQNLKYPVNTNADDYAIIFNPNSEEEGFFTSSRKMNGLERNKGGDDIYYFIIPPLEFTLSGVVKDDRSLQYLEGAEVRMVGSDGSSIVTTTNSIGRYEFSKEQFLPKTTYELAISKDNYFSSTGSETTVGVEKSRDFVLDFTLKPIPKKPIVLPEILYDLAKWDLKPQYQDSLQGLIKTLDDNPRMVVELASHTDARDTDERNDILSQRRAQSVVDYLILRGIDPDRLVAKGYGERAPRELLKDYYLNGIAVLDSGNVLTEEFINKLKDTEQKEFAHQLNRRTEFSVLRNDFVPKERLDTVVVPVARKINIVINPELEESYANLIKDADGRFGVRCEVNGYPINVYIDKSLREPAICLADALSLLREGAIGKDDFAGDPLEILADASIQDKAYFLIEEIKIEKNYITMIEVMVNHKLERGFYLDEATFSQIGNYKIDEENNKMIFEQ
ncbi:MAG: OmpA family protein [Bacteroidales bacterium]|nr:OmpA family protein [Bacteroidales bacterium]MCF8404406.1 OmpA family protein [Bacteroidales bacterium]